MLTLEEAIKIAETARGSKVVNASDFGDRWSFYFEDDEPKPCDYIDDPEQRLIKEVLSCQQREPVFVYKSDGRVRCYLAIDIVDMLASGEMTCTPVKLPE